MAPFAGYDMPIHYPAGHPRRASAHARQRRPVRRLAHGPGACSTAPITRRPRARSSALCPADILALAPGRQRYTQFLNADGGVIDDLMVTRPPGADGRLSLVVNAARKAVDFALLDAASAGRRAADAGSTTRR